VKRGHKVTVVGAIPAHIQPRNSETGSKVLIRPSRIRAKGSGNYWKDITLTEKILKFNGMNATYETVNVEAATVSNAANTVKEPKATVTAEPDDTDTEDETVEETTGSNVHEPMFSADI
jgi:hypothetical protein